PGLFAPGGLLGGGAQTTAWLYMGWHAGFPLAVTAYALMGRRGQVESPPIQAPRLVIVAGIFAVVAIVCGLTLVATAGHNCLPPIMAGNPYTGAMRVVVATVWTLSLAALVAMLCRREPSVLDSWLVVVMTAWLCDIGLAAGLNGGRFDLGF